MDGAGRHGSNRGSQLADLASAAALDAGAPPRLMGRIRMDPAKESIAVKSLLSASTRRAAPAPSRPPRTARRRTRMRGRCGCTAPCSGRLVANAAAYRVRRLLPIGARGILCRGGGHGDVGGRPPQASEVGGQIRAAMPATRSPSSVPGPPLLTMELPAACVALCCLD